MSKSSYPNADSPSQFAIQDYTLCSTANLWHYCWPRILLTLNISTRDNIIERFLNPYSKFTCTNSEEKWIQPVPRNWNSNCNLLSLLSINNYRICFPPLGPIKLELWFSQSIFILLVADESRLENLLYW